MRYIEYVQEKPYSELTPEEKEHSKLRDKDDTFAQLQVHIDDVKQYLDFVEISEHSKNVACNLIEQVEVVVKSERKMLGYDRDKDKSLLITMEIQQ